MDIPQGCCPMFEDNLIVKRFLIEEDDKVVFSNCEVTENALLDCPRLLVYGNLTVRAGAEVSCLSLEVFGNLVVERGAVVNVEGDEPPIIHGNLSGEGTLAF